MNRSDSIGQIAAALSIFQGAIANVVKDSSGYNYQYADIAAVWGAIREPLAANNLAVFQDVNFTPFSRSESEAPIYGVTIKTLLCHKSGEFIESEGCFVPAPKQDPQGVGSAITYARRYDLMAVLGIAPMDDDGAAASGNPNDRQLQEPAAASKSGSKAKSQSKAAAAPAETDPIKLWLGASTPAYKRKDEIIDVCKKLVQNGVSDFKDLSSLNKHVEAEFDKPLKSLDDESITVLVTDLTERLNERLAIAGEETAPTSLDDIDKHADAQRDAAKTAEAPPKDDSEPMAQPGQIDALRKLCDIKDLDEAAVIKEASGGTLTAFDQMTEHQAATLIKQINAKK